MCSQGDISCGPSSHPDFIKNYFLSNSPFPPIPDGRMEQLMPPSVQLCPKHLHPPVIVVHIAARRSPAPSGGQSIRQGFESGFSKENQNENIFFPASFPNLRTQRQLAATGKTFSNVAQQSLKKCTITRFVNLVSRFSHKTSSVYFPAVTLRMRATREHFNGASGEMIT